MGGCIIAREGILTLKNDKEESIAVGCKAGIVGE
jgi:hypothetical protein